MLGISSKGESDLLGLLGWPITILGIGFLIDRVADDNLKQLIITYFREPRRNIDIADSMGAFLTGFLCRLLGRRTWSIYFFFISSVLSVLVVSLVLIKQSLTPSTAM